MSDKFLIVGLGNPGRDYERTRHNAGFHVIDGLARRHNLTNFTAERKAFTVDGVINGKRVILAKPQTYMNLSGESVRALVDFYKIDIGRILVIYDDLDLPLGTIRLRHTGGHGGQNGVRSIIKHLGTEDFGRLRFGIGRPPGRMKAKDYVLQKFSGDDALLADEVVEASLDAIEKWLAEGMQMAMSQHNGDIHEPDEQPAKADPREELHIAIRAHELAPNNPKPLEEMAKLYKRMRQLDEAAQAHLKLAALYRDQKNPRQMLREWEQAARIRPMMIELREEIAITYEEMEDIKRAVQTWLSLAEYQEQHVDADAALASVEEALRLNDQHPKALEMKERLTALLTL